MKDSISQLDDNPDFEEHDKKRNVLNRCKLIKIKNAYKWTANVSFVSYNPEQRDRAYRKWVKAFIRVRKMKDKKE